MIPFRSRQPSLFWKILLSTSIAITLLLALAGWFAQDQTRSVLLRNLQSELRGSFGAYESLWQSRAATLRSVSLVLSGKARDEIRVRRHDDLHQGSRVRLRS